MHEKLTIIDSKHVGDGEQNTLSTKNAVNDLYDISLLDLIFGYLVY